MNQDFKNWLLSRKIGYEIFDRYIDIPEFGRVYFIEETNGKVLDEDFALIVDESGEETIVQEDIDYVAFKFGENIYYTSIADWEAGVVRFLVLEYVGVCTDKTSAGSTMLGVHGMYEILSGTRPYESWVDKAKFLGLSTLGICEKNTLGGVLNFQKTCLKNGITPVIGESIMISTSGSDIWVKLYVVNEIGWQNLLKIDAAINCSNPERKLSASFFEKCSTGLICVIDSFAIPFLKDIKNGLDGFDRVYFNIDFREYDSSRLDQDYLEWGVKYFKYWIDEYPPIMIPDAYFLERDHFHIRDSISKINSPFAIQNHLSIDRYFNSNGDLLKSMFDLFNNKKNGIKIFKTSLSNAKELSSYCLFNIDMSDIYMPKYQMTDAEVDKYTTPYNMFLKLCSAGLREKVDLRPDNTKEYVERLKLEIGVIKDAEFVDYFLILWSIIDFCDKGNIQYALGRGSAAGSLVSYSLGIVGIDPIEWDLSFARFLNSGRIPKYEMRHFISVDYKGWKHKFLSTDNICIDGEIVQVGEFIHDQFSDGDQTAQLFHYKDYTFEFKELRYYTRKSLPDIDSDFDSRRRGEVVDFLRERLGDDRVCAIGTIQELGLKSGVKDFGKMHGAGFDVTNNINKKFDYEAQTRESVEDAVGKINDLEKILWTAHDSKPVKDFMTKYPSACQDLLLVSGSPKSVGQHACGYLTVPKHDQLGNELTIFNLLPVRLDGDTYVSMWQGGEVEDLGMVKLDILATKQLSKFADILKLVKEEEGKILKLTDIPLDDEQVFAYFKNGWNQDVFQFNSAGMTKFSKDLSPDNIHDLVAMNALFRPATLRMKMHEAYINRKNGTEDWEPLWGCEEILKSTYGIICYQEQSMKVVQVVGGFTEVESDDFRKVTAKKKMDQIDAFAEKFIEGAVDRGCPPEEAQAIWKLLVKFAEYSFNLSHAACYGIIGYVSQWLKVHYPLYFWKTALEMVDDKKMNLLLEEMENIGHITISPPDINKSYSKFVIKDGDIFWSMNRVKFVGDVAVAEILRSRREEGMFFSMSEFLSRVDASKVNSRIVRNLIISGAFDEVCCIQEPKERLGIIEEYLELSGKKWDKLQEYEGKNNSFWSLQEKDLSGIGVINYKQEILSNDETKGLFVTSLEGLSQ